MKCFNRHMVKDKPIRIQPVVTQLVDPAVLEKMKVKVKGEGSKKAQSPSANKQDS